jgi:chromosome segregation ATPase
VETPAVPARLIGAIFVEKGLVTEHDLERALEEQQRTGMRLGEILVASYGVSRLDLASALADQWAALERPRASEQESEEDEHAAEADLAAVSAEWSALDTGESGRRPIGEIFVEQGSINEEQLEHALAVQQQTGQRLGEILVAQGSLSRLELASALADQWADLQKLRPPAPPDPQGRLRRPSEAGVDMSPEAEERRRLDRLFDELRAELEAAAARLDELDSRVGEAERQDLRGELEALRSDLARRADTFEAAGTGVARRLADLATELPPLANSVDELRKRVDELAAEHLDARIEEVATGVREGLAAVSNRIDETRERLAEDSERRDRELLEAVDGLSNRLGGAEALAARVDAVVARDVAAEVRAGLISELEVARVDAGRVEELDRTVGEIRRAVAEAARDNVVREAVEELSRRISAAASADDLRAAVASLAERIDAAAAGDLEVAGRLSRLERQLDDAAGSQAERQGAAMRRLEALESRDAGAEARQELRSELESARADAARVEALDRAVGELRDALAAVDQEGAGALRRAVEELDRRVGAAAGADEVRETVASLWGRLEAAGSYDGELAGRLGELERRLLELAPLAGLRAEVDQRLVALERRLENAAGAVDPRIYELAARLEATEQTRERVEALEGAVRELGTAVEAATQREDDELKRAVEELERQLTAAGMRMEALEGRDVAGEVRSSLEELSRRVADATSADDLRAALAPVWERLEAIAADGELAGRLGELERRLVELSPASDSSPEVDGRLEAMERRLEEAAGVQAGLHDELAELRGRIEGIGPVVDRELRESIDELRGRIEAVGPVADPRVDELAGRMAELEGAAAERERGIFAAVDERVSGLQAEVGSRVDELRDGLRGRLEGLAASFDHREHELEERVRARVASLEQRLEHTTAEGSIESLRARLDELAAFVGERDAAAATRAEQLEHALAGREAALEQRLRDQIEETARRHDHTATHERLEALAREVHARVDELGASVESAREELGSAAGAVLGVGEEQLLAAERVVVLQGEVAALGGEIARLVAREDGLEERDRSVRAEIEAIAAVLAESGGAAADVDAIRAAVADLERRLEELGDRSAEQVRVTERALRKGLASLGERLAESQTAYVEAGDALHRSIEPLGRAIGETDVRIAVRAHDAVAERTADATAYVAFLPTRDGYRLVACEGAPPQLDARLELDDCDGTLVVRRIGASPLPLDERPCVFLERAAQL